MRIVFLFLLLASNYFAISQQAPLLYGYVVSEESNNPLDGATIVAIKGEQQLSAISDSEGYFAFPGLIAGRYSLEVNFLGFQSQRLVEILIEAGRAQEIKIYLAPTTLDLPMAVVRAGIENSSTKLLPGAQILTIEETRRLPATFNDPARQLIAYPGVVNTSDQANNISVRGNSPVSLAWRLEGAEIVNPNHLSNAGTRTDRISEASGGVNMLSAQMLSTSNFYAGAAPVEYGNLQGGLMDMRMRSGNREKWEGTFQLGLLGMDASMEGPFSKKKKGASYLFNYRYSTLGVLNALGVELGDEEISFQDFALHLNFPSKKLGTFSFFGIAGASDTYFTPEKDSSLWETLRDSRIVDYYSGAFVTGFKHLVSINNKGSWKTTAVYSGASNSRGEFFDDGGTILNKISRENFFQEKLTVRTKVDYAFDPKISATFGLEDASQRLNARYNDNSTNGDIRKSFTLNSFRTFGHLNLILLNQFNLNIGGTFQFNSGLDLNETALLPNLSIKYAIDRTQTIRFSYAKYLRNQPAFQYITPFDSTLLLVNTRNNLLSYQNNNVSLSYELMLKKDSRLRTELYYQYIENAATLINEAQKYSSLNFEESTFPSFGTLTNNGQGRNYGLEILWQKYITEDFYYLTNASFFKSEYKNGLGAWRPTRYDAGYLFNLTVGKEYRWKKKWDKTLGINLRLTYLGNLRYTPIDLENSIAEGVEVLSEDVYSEKLKPYAKGDLRIYLRTDKIKYSSSLSLDVQNFFNRKNDGFYFFDPRTEIIQSKKQLGLIPILNWRISF